ncbi:peptidoglycan-binding protein [Paenarthrobacter sp. NPDC089675]|uniref:peptidoglycan-binding protein n=1 Tax=Paenarthrobacter sp. NPDC089675 TaxID=3364376 RepID=UPI003816A6FF
MKLPRVPRFRRVVVFLCVIFVCTAGSFFLGSQMRTPESSAIDSINSKVDVSAAVEKKSLATSVIVSATMSAGPSVPLQASVPKGADRAVVTAVYASIGETVAPGSLIAAVSGRPVLVMSSNVPLYRDLLPGDRGPDVMALQKWLQGLAYWPGVTGVFDQGTESALKNLYRDLQLTAPTSEDGKVAFRWREFVQIPGDSGKITSLVRPGDVLAEDLSLGRVQTAPDVVVGRATVDQADALVVGQEVDLQAAGYSAKGTIQSIGAFNEGDPDKGVVPGMDIVSAVPVDGDQPKPGQSVSIKAHQTAVESLAVPLTAVKQDDHGTYVTLPGTTDHGESSSSPERVDITVTQQRDGWAAIEENPRLQPGTLVTVS